MSSEGIFDDPVCRPTEGNYLSAIKKNNNNEIE